MTSCWFQSWKHSHRAFCHCTLHEMLDNFHSVCVVTELSVAPTNSCPVVLRSSQHPRTSPDTPIISRSAYSRRIELENYAVGGVEVEFSSKFVLVNSDLICVTAQSLRYKVNLFHAACCIWCISWGCLEYKCYDSMHDCDYAISNL